MTVEEQSLQDKIYRLQCELATANQKITWLTLGYNHSGFSFSTEQDRSDNQMRCERFGSTPGQLQFKWRNPYTIPNVFAMPEAEAAILDAFIQGGAHVWTGDGSSMAVQIVEAVWIKKQQEIDQLKHSITEKL